MDETPSTADISDVLEEGRLVVCGGPGGVGKTTTSAALALRAALAGRKVVVITIDPAKRLANSLGLQRLSHEPEEIDLADFARDDDGELWAMMLDQQKTFDELVQRTAPDEGALERSRSNEIYQLLTSALHGMQEYAALDKLHDLYTGGYFDLIVLDTPPTANALEFLDAPRRMKQFFDRRIMKWFLPDESRSSSWFGSLLNPAGSVVLKVLSKIVGERFVDELVEFFDTFHYLQETLHERGDMIEYILRDDRTHFMLVTTAAPRRIDEVVHFHDKLEEFDQTARAFIVNRVTPQFDLEDLEGVDGSDLRAFFDDRGVAAEEEDFEGLYDVLEEQYAALARLAARDRKSIGRLGERVGSDQLQLVPILGEDVHTLEDLIRLGEFLTPDHAGSPGV